MHQIAVLHASATARCILLESELLRPELYVAKNQSRPLPATRYAFLCVLSCKLLAIAFSGVFQ